jgi:pilus assembly protein Flp/PilA
MTFRTFLSNFHEDESGQDLIEYALVCALIALGAIAGMQSVANAINSAFDKVGSELSSATTANPGS